MASTSADLSAISNALAATAKAESAVANLTGSTALSASASDLMSIAKTTKAIANTTNTVLATLKTITSDPLSGGYTKSKAYSGSFVTKKTSSNTGLVDFAIGAAAVAQITSRLTSSQIGSVSSISSSMSSMLSTQSKYLSSLASTITTDAKLAASLANIASGVASQLKMFKQSGLVALGATAAVLGTGYIASSLSLSTSSISSSSFTSFLKQATAVFSSVANATVAIEKCYQTLTSSCTDAYGKNIPGVPRTASSSTYSSLSTITKKVSVSASTATIPTTTDYSTTQNTFNTTLTLNIENGFTTLVEPMLIDSSFNSTSIRVIKSLLMSVCKRGDVYMAYILINAIGGKNVINPAAMINYILKNEHITSSEDPSSSSTSTDSNINTYTADEYTTYINEIMTLTNVSQSQLYNSKSNSSLYNYKTVKASSSSTVTNSLLTSNVVKLVSAASSTKSSSNAIIA